MIKLPVFQSTSANFRYTIDLDVQKVTIQAVYNIRNGFFHLWFTDEAGTELTGIKIVPDWPLLDIHKALLSFEGDLMVIKEDSSLGDEIDFDNFGNGFNFYYLTEDEVEAWKVENGL